MPYSRLVLSEVANASEVKFSLTDVVRSFREMVLRASCSPQIPRCVCQGSAHFCFCSSRLILPCLCILSLLLRIHVPCIPGLDGAKTIGKSVRNFLSGSSVTSYPTLTVSTTDHTYQDRNVSGPSTIVLFISRFLFECGLCCYFLPPARLRGIVYNQD